MNSVIRKFLALVPLMFLGAGQVLSCPVAAPSSSAEFCQSFKAVAECHCVSKGIPRGMCSNMNMLYQRMVDALGNLQRACAFQHDTATQECIEDWNCYRYGGFTANGQLCNGNGHACM